MLREKKFPMELLSIFDVNIFDLDGLRCEWLSRNHFMLQILKTKRQASKKSMR